MIYKAKGRPSINPLIIHVYENKDVFEIAVKNKIAQDLSSKFWPGPLTLILNKKNNAKLKLAKNALAGLSTIAARVPSHPVFRNLLKKCKLPITGLRCVKKIVTELAVIDIVNEEFVLKEIAPGVTLDEVISSTEGKLNIPEFVPTMKF